MQETRNKVQTGFFAALLIGALIINYFIFKPYISVIFMALIIVLIFKPVHEKIFELVGKRGSIASLISSLSVVVVILLPISLFGFLIFKDAQNFYEKATSGGFNKGWVNDGIVKIETTIDRFAPDEVNVDVREYIQTGAKYLVQNLDSIFTRIFAAIFETFLLILALFYFFRDGKKFREHFIGLSPLSDKYDKTILGRLEAAVNAVVRGVLLIAVIQGVVTAVGFAIFGVPNPMLWGAVAAIAAIIPTIGTALVIIPAVIYLFFVSGLGWAIGLALWGVAVVGLIDNVLAPIFMERGLKIHPFLILMSVLGGVAFFGPVGFLAGPVVLTLLFALFDLYPLVVEGRAGGSNNVIE